MIYPSPSCDTNPVFVTVSDPDSPCIRSTSFLVFLSQVSYSLLYQDTVHWFLRIDSGQRHRDKQYDDGFSVKRLPKIYAKCYAKVDPGFHKVKCEGGWVGGLPNTWIYVTGA